MPAHHIHMVSDSTGETVSSVLRAAMAQFEGVEVEEHNWALVRTGSQVDRALEGIRQNPGFVMYTVSDRKLRNHLREGCEKIGVPCVSVLSRVLSDLKGFFGVQTTEPQPGRQHELDDKYFSRVEAMNFSLSHDDGHSPWDLEEADIIIVGVSRTSKSPTSMYLAYRGYRTANIPYVPGIELPGNLQKLKGPLIVALAVQPEVLVQIRRNRLLSIHQEPDGLYTNIEQVEDELKEARQFFARQHWPVIDVTRRSVEETAATILQYYERHRFKIKG